MGKDKKLKGCWGAGLDSMVMFLFWIDFDAQNANTIKPLLILERLLVKSN
jgi:hypothetical protein